MRFLLAACSSILLIFGATLLAFGFWRYRLPYENERYFDPSTAIVYHLETAEVCVTLGAGFGFLGLFLLIICLKIRKARLAK